MNELAECTFLPWKGDNYEAGREGVRVLLLGESHYGPPDGEPANLTKCVVKRYAIDGPTLRFFTVACRAVLAGCGKMNEFDDGSAWETRLRRLDAVPHPFELGVG